MPFSRLNPQSCQTRPGWISGLVIMKQRNVGILRFVGRLPIFNYSRPLIMTAADPASCDDRKVGRRVIGPNVNRHEASSFGIGLWGFLFIYLFLLKT